MATLGKQKSTCWLQVPSMSLYVCIRLSNCENGLNRWMEIEGLEVCGSNGIWKPVKYAKYEQYPQPYLRIRCDEVNNPCEVRYGWGDFVPGNLSSSEGLPLTPFWLQLGK